MESPLKQPIFTSDDKENTTSQTISEPIKPTTEAVTGAKPTTQLSKLEQIKAMEAEEPLLQENPGRFVLFPLK